MPDTLFSHKTHIFWIMSDGDGPSHYVSLHFPLRCFPTTLVSAILLRMNVWLVNIVFDPFKTKDFDNLRRVLSPESWILFHVI